MKTSPALRLWREAHRKSANLAAKRAEMPIGSPRARVTSANAQWSRWAEERERLYNTLSPEERKLADAEMTS